MPWLLLVIAGLLEVVWAIAMKRSDGFLVRVLKPLAGTPVGETG